MNSTRNQYTIFLRYHRKNIIRECEKRERILHKIFNYSIRGLHHVNFILLDNKKNPKKIHPYKNYNGLFSDPEKSRSPSLSMIYCSVKENIMKELHHPSDMTKTRPNLLTYFPKKTNNLYSNGCLYINRINLDSKQNPG